MKWSDPEVNATGREYGHYRGFFLPRYFQHIVIVGYGEDIDAFEAYFSHSETYAHDSEAHLHDFEDN